MSFQLQNFSKSYQQAVSSIKQIKQCNQRIQQKSSIDYKNQQIMIQNAKRKVLNWVSDIEKQYLDPQTSRRVQIVKQQLNTQYKKYQQLMSQMEKKGKVGVGVDAGKVEVLASQDQEGQNNLLMFQHQTQTRLQQQKSNELSQAHKKLLNIHSLTEETKKLTYEQGQNIDIIDENISTTHSNVKQSNKYLDIANSEHKKSQKKYICLVAIVSAIIAIILLLIFLL